MVARIVDIDLLDREGLFGSVKNCCFHDLCVPSILVVVILATVPY
jgi:hypothetical protein